MKITTLLITTTLLAACGGRVALTDQTYDGGKASAVSTASASTALAATTQVPHWDCPHRIEAAKHCVERDERSTEPTRPTEPGKPTEPEQPTEPGKPTEPEKPTKPEQPTEPEKPTEPEQPTEPEKPKGNPGNNLPVGQAGEKPNKKEGWGEGTNGRAH